MNTSSIKSGKKSRPKSVCQKYIKNFFLEYKQNMKYLPSGMSVAGMTVVGTVVGHSGTSGQNIVSDSTSQKHSPHISSQSGAVHESMHVFSLILSLSKGLPQVALHSVHSVQSDNLHQSSKIAHPSVSLKIQKIEKNENFISKITKNKSKIS